MGRNYLAKLNRFLLKIPKREKMENFFFKRIKEDAYSHQHKISQAKDEKWSWQTPCLTDQQKFEKKAAKHDVKLSRCCS